MTRLHLYVLLVLVCVTFTCSAQSNSCTGRCGEDYYRGYLCHCDYDCLTHNECCKDYEAKCTTRGSCKGRCGESFKRGRQCDCDSDCAKFGQCCPDHKQFCAAEDPPMPEDSAAQSEGEDVNEGISDIESPADPSYEEQPAPPPPEDEETPVPEGTSGYEPLATSVPESPRPTIAVVMPMTSVPDDAEAGLQADLEGEGLSLDGPTMSAVPDLSHVPASQIPTTINPDSTPPASNLSDSISTQASTPASDGEEQADTTQSAAVADHTVSPASQDQDPANTTPSVAGEPVVPPEDESIMAPAEPLDSTAASTPASTPAGEEGNTPALDDQKKPDEDATSTEGPTASDNPANGDPPGAEDATESTASPAVKPMEEQDATTTKPPPSDQVTVPTDQIQDSKQDTLDPQSPAATTSASEATVKPLEMTPKPLETTAKPVEATPKPLETTAKPVEATPKPLETTAKPVEATPKSLETTAKPVEKTTKAPKVTPLPSKPTKKPEKPSSSNDIEFPGMDNTRDYQADDSNDTNLCSGRPVNGLTTLKNGTTVVFRGHYFWMLDALRTPGPAQGITATWGIPSPIDTVFTRCNCQGKTYFLKGRSYWRFENDIMDPGYPKAISRGFDGLSGHITAALSVPSYLRRRESVYFFKRGGRVQKYSYDPTKAPKCSKSQPSQPNHRVQYTVFTRRTRHAETYLGKELSIAATWKGFPTTVTSAVSIPSRQTVDGYKYYVFSRSRHYSIRIDGERPTVTTPARPTQTQGTPQSFFNCPKKDQA